MNPPDGIQLLLDSAGLADLALAGRQGPHARLAGLLERAWSRNAPVLVPAVVCAEVCRDRRRTAAVESLLRRHQPDRLRTGAIEVVPTDFGLARQVGSVLHAAGASSSDIVDAHLVALCLGPGSGVVATSDPDDIRRLAAPFPALRVVTYRIDGPT